MSRRLRTRQQQELRDGLTTWKVPLLGELEEKPEEVEDAVRPRPYRVKKI